MEPRTLYNAAVAAGLLMPNTWWVGAPGGYIAKPCAIDAENAVLYSGDESADGEPLCVSLSDVECAVMEGLRAKRIAVIPVCEITPSSTWCVVTMLVPDHSLATGARFPAFSADVQQMPVTVIAFGNSRAHALCAACVTLCQSR